MAVTYPPGPLPKTIMSYFILYFYFIVVKMQLQKLVSFFCVFISLMNLSNLQNVKFK